MLKSYHSSPAVVTLNADQISVLLVEARIDPEQPEAKMKRGHRKSILSSGKHTDSIYYHRAGDDTERFTTAIKATKTKAKQIYKREPVLPCHWASGDQ